MEQAADELAWLSEKEEIEVSRDWSSQNLQLHELENYFEVSQSSLVVLWQMYRTVVDDMHTGQQDTYIFTDFSSLLFRYIFT